MAEKRNKGLKVMPKSSKISVEGPALKVNICRVICVSHCKAAVGRLIKSFFKLFNGTTK